MSAFGVEVKVSICLACIWSLAFGQEPLEKGEEQLLLIPVKGKAEPFFPCCKLLGIRTRRARVQSSLFTHVSPLSVVVSEVLIENEWSVSEMGPWIPEVG